MTTIANHSAYTRSTSSFARSTKDTSTCNNRRRQRSRLENNIYSASITQMEKQKNDNERSEQLTACLIGSKSGIVKYVLKLLKFHLSTDDQTASESNLIWTDGSISQEMIVDLKPYQWINHFFRMNEISRKDFLCRNITKLAKYLPDDYNYFPRSWTLPNEFNSFQQYATTYKKNSLSFIVKPANGSMGNGIHLHYRYETVANTGGGGNQIVQEYIDKPLLIEGHKFDIRIYCLITCCDPLKIFIYNQGLVRISTEPYERPTSRNINNLFMHLTNYSVNKNHENYNKDDAFDCGNKRSLLYLFEYLKNNDIDPSFVWTRIQNVVLKTIFIAQPYLYSAYKICRPHKTTMIDSVCFEILGFDILLDEDLNPWLLEVNRSPSFGTAEKIDREIKFCLLRDCFRLLRIRKLDKMKCRQTQKENTRKRLLISNRQMRPTKDSSLSVKSSLRLKETIQRREELISNLKLKRLENDQLDYENRNCGNFTCLFPCHDKFRVAKLRCILEKCFQLFLTTSNIGLLSSHSFFSKFDSPAEGELIGELAKCVRIEIIDSNLSSDKFDERKLKNIASREDDYSYGKNFWEVVEKEQQEKLTEIFETLSDSESSQDDDDNHNDINGNGYTDRIMDENYDVSMRDVSFSPKPNEDDDHQIMNRLLKQTKNYPSIAQLGAEHRSMEPNSSHRLTVLTEREEEALAEGLNECRSNGKSHKITGKQKLKKSIRLPLNENDQRNDIDQIQKNLMVIDRSHTVTPLACSVIKQSPTLINRKPYVDVMPDDATYWNDFRISSEVVDMVRKVQYPETPVNALLNEPNNDVETKLLNVSLASLCEMRLKLPNKNVEQSDESLLKFLSTWKMLKDNVRYYWISILNDGKRKDIFNIVRQNVREILETVYQTKNLASVRIYRIMSRLHTRLLSSNGYTFWSLFDNKQNKKYILGRIVDHQSMIHYKCNEQCLRLYKTAVIFSYITSMKAKNGSSPSSKIIRRYKGASL
ncbi:hypothetical protein SNEBB_003718 [Seison nebaliae]|nr:hypothetical protein SNEBB_003718 [Seison nebaliae]